VYLRAGCEVRHCLFSGSSAFVAARVLRSGRHVEDCAFAGNRRRERRRRVLPVRRLVRELPFPDNTAPMAAPCTARQAAW